MNNLLKNLGVAESFSVKGIVSIEELNDHDMVYIYHHLGVGSVVDLELVGENVKGDPRYAVRYRQFLLGYITISGILKAFYEGVTNGAAEISAIGKDKFFPFKEVDLQIGVQAMKKVG